MKKLFLYLSLFIAFPAISQVTLNNYTYHFGDSAWTDLRAPATTIRQGATTKPDFNTDSLTLDFPQNDEAEKAYIIMQMGHDYLEGSDISPHIHYLQNEAGVPVFVMLYRWILNGQITTGWTTLESNGIVFSYASGSILQIMEFPMIDGSGKSGVSSVLQIVLYRKTGDGVAGDVQVVEFDIHYQRDSFGSDTEYNRTWD